MSLSTRKKREKELAKVSKKETSMYTRSDVQKAIEYAAAQTRKYMEDQFEKKAKNYIVPLLDSDTLITVLITRIEDAAMNINREQGRETLEQMRLSDALGAEFIHNTELKRAIGMQTDEQERRMISEYIDGAICFINGKKGSNDPEGDDGEKLREVITRYPSKPSQTMLAIRELIDIGGSKIEAYRIHLKKDYLEMCQHHPKANAHEMFILMIDLYETIPESERKPWQKPALEELKIKRNSQAERDYWRNLRNVGAS